MSIRDSIYQNLESVIVNKQNVAASAAALDTFVREHKKEIPGDLAHYLENRSYAKAWAWFQDGKHAPRGTCSSGK